jgi:predicted RecB family endonuclease
MMHIREEDLRCAVHDYFKCKNYSIFDEHKLFARKIDIVAKRRNEIITIELKMRAWERAIQQAYLNQRVSNYSYIALPENILNNSKSRLFDEAFKNGIGIISVNGSAKQIMGAKKSNQIQSCLRSNFIKSLSSEEE